MRDIIVLADDLVLAISSACWTDMKGKPKLLKPTPHMVDAINAYELIAHPKCPTCGKGEYVEKGL